MAKEMLRVRCPVCQQMTELNRMAAAKDKPTEVQVFLQTMGGKSPVVQVPGEYKKVGRGKAPGLLTIAEITDTMSASQLQPIREWFVGRAKKFLGK
jgi:hypothetical protein